MSLSRRTTVLFSQELYERLAREAERRRSSIGHLIREACATAYQVDSVDERLAAVERLAELALPVGTPDEMAEQSLPHPDELMP